ncbi:MAG: Ubiquinol-cytochrome c reductase iron-sulfur subunit [Candidatus Hodgkinia cicadicola]|nr:MAG: Ubiquinol-cytochrome c reductase iron-sulfur subunit [Candidatus Hodgkinia cicadicola]
MLTPILNIDGVELFYGFTCVIIAIGAGIISWPLASQFLPNAYVSVNPKMEIDLRAIRYGQCVTINWFGTPVFVRNRLAREVRAARVVRIRELKDRYARNANINSNALAFDRNRCLDTQSENWLVVIAPCTHLGCMPNVTEHGWACACHGSSYDLSGRIASGPAHANLDVPKCLYAVNSLVLGL